MSVFYNNYLSCFSHLTAALKDFKADFIIYNAGTDILIGDRLGNLDITAEVNIEFKFMLDVELGCYVCFKRNHLHFCVFRVLNKEMQSFFKLLSTITSLLLW